MNKMNLNFGEILIDQSSRAFYDDYDDLSLNENFCRPQWTFMDRKSFPKEITQLTIVEGANACKILETYVLRSKELLGTTTGLRAYLLDTQNVICVTDGVDINQWSAISMLLDPLQAIATECIIVSLQSLSEYKSNMNPNECITRSFGYSTSILDIPSLTAPNFISGICAGLATSREMDRKSFQCFVAYIDLFDEQAVIEVLRLFQKIGLPVDETVKISPLHHKSDLYM